MEQKIAINPQNNIWVGASAGSGKTTILVKRLLKLLLSGVELSKIVCITFTKTGSTEMKHRINTKLASWATMDDDELQKELEELGDGDKKQKAKTLFAEVLDRTDDLKIFTIHSFCQQIIKQFPLEVGIVPNFQIIDDIGTKDLLEKAKKNVFENNEEAKEAMKYIFKYKTIEDFNETLKSLVNKKDELLLLGYNIFDEIKKIIIGEEKFDLEKKVTIPQDIITFLKNTGSVMNKNFAEKYENGDWNEYKSIFLTQENKPRAKIFTKEMYEKYPDFAKILTEERDRIYEVAQYEMNLENFEYTKAFLRIGYGIFDEYDKEKKEKGVLDYNDLLFYTKKLLKNGIGWVNYKLDGGIEHILIDEAQDTSPIQWEIVKCITEEFFAGQNRQTENGINRTIFVVGDEKQSIFGFQGANVEEFFKNHKYYNEKTDLKLVSLNRSYRSFGAILNTVDKVFNNGDRLKAISNIKSENCENILNELKHIANKGAGGRVEILPLVVPIKKNTTSTIDWANPDEDIELTGKQELAIALSNEIESWFKCGKIINNRPLKYKDIMILVRARNDIFLNFLIKQFSEKGIPVMGNDRFKLKSHIISKDIIALLKVLLFPDDDLNLANIVKSPFLGMTDNELEWLCLNNDSVRLFDAINSSFLFDLMEKYSDMGIFKTLQYIFEKTRDKFRNRFGEIADEIINEFLFLASNYENNNTNSTLLNFVNYIETNDMDLKRDMVQANNVIRIMTVHASKGMESPIVILPDTNHTKDSIEKIDDVIYRNNMPILSLNKTKNIDEIKKYEKLKQREEYLRLLYVAMTRAENELYICDCEKKKNDEENWYNILKETITDNKYDNKNFNGESFYIGEESKCDKSEHKELKDVQKLINFMPPSHETRTNDTEYKIVNPSLYYMEKTFKKTTDNNKNIEIGKTIHKLLEIMPNESILASQSPEIQKVIKNILTNFPFLFNEQVKNEVAIYGKISQNMIDALPDYNLKVGDIISGQIDKLIVYDDKIIIVDYKHTNHLPEKVPDKYIKQLILYKKLLEKIYGDKKIVESYILWTNYGKMSKV
ncbi:MAG: UvrD-helicase domain-containing protein [Rickettsiales bacterium]|jgi:ATP-dependent helicase/nuclease subunit A|nr:UvrD-helicase domain-containing protein [Rickettsiales bacterium]